MSNSNTPNGYPQNDEVNLMPLFYFLKRQIDRVSNFFIFLYKTFEKRFFLIVSFFLIGVVLGIANYFFSTPIYKSTAIYTSNLLSNEYSESFVNELEWLTSERNYKELAEVLNISLKDSEKIQKIEFESFSASSKDTVIGKPFKVHAFVYNNQVLDTLQNAILYYMENNAYAAKRKSSKKNTLLEFSNRMQSEILELDSLKKIVNKGSIELSVETYKQIIDLHMQRLLTMERIALLNNFDLIQEFTVFRRPASPRKYFDTAIISFICSLIGFFYAIWLEKKEQKRKLNAVTSGHIPINENLDSYRK